jgi:hypothetical protein
LTEEVRDDRAVGEAIGVNIGRPKHPNAFRAKEKALCIALEEQMLIGCIER